MTVNFWCGAVAFMAVYFGFVLFVLYDSTGSARLDTNRG